MRTYNRCNTVAKALNSDAPKLSVLVKTLGIKAVEAYLKMWLIDLDRILDLKKPLNEAQIDDLAFRIVDNYRSLNIADINLIFAGVKNGETEKIYDRITIPTVMKWFNDYFNERCNTAAEESYQQHVQHKVQMRNLGDSLTVTNKEKHQKAAKFHTKMRDMAQAQKRINNVKNKMKRDITLNPSTKR